MLCDVWDMMYGAVIQDENGSFSYPIKLLHVWNKASSDEVKNVTIDRSLVQVNSYNSICTHGGNSRHTRASFK